MKCLEWPFDSSLILKKKRSIKKELLACGTNFLDKRIAILGGSTTDEIKNILELFLLNYTIRPIFYQSEYGQYWQDAIFSEELISFKPDIIFIHTTSRNISVFPTVRDNKEQIAQKHSEQIQHFISMWDKLAEFNCPVIQNNFERPLYRLLGNRDAADIHGRTNFISSLNQSLYDYAETHNHLYVHDIDYLAADFGHSKWANPFYWHMYKYALAVEAIPEFAFSLAGIIKSIYGKNKKIMALDLDNTLWGGVIGDDGVTGIALGPEMPMGQVYSEFQDYVKLHKDLGIMLCVCSKNDIQNAITGLNHPDSSLKPHDFVAIKANWENKDRNIAEIANQLDIGTDSFVFVDDNPAEREIVAAQLEGIAVPNIGNVEEYIMRIDRSGFFETVTISKDDIKRNEMYAQNAKRKQFSKSFKNYSQYLKSLEMTADIKDFEPVYMQRITQLTNKSNQFNLTTRRYTESEMEKVTKSEQYIRLYGKLIDKFGDNGVVSVIIGEKQMSRLHIDLWLMSCRVLKRDMEFAMFDELVNQCLKNEIFELVGYYYPTAKNEMVRYFYKKLGFEMLESKADGSTVWQYKINNHTPQNHVIVVNKNITEQEDNHDKE